MAPLCSPLCSTIVLTPVLTTGLRQCAPPLCSPLCSPLAASTCCSAPVAAGVPADLSERILEFFEYKLRSSKSGLQTTGIDELPAELAMLLTIQLHKDIIQKCPIFTNLPAQHLVSLLRKMRPVIFVPGHLVVKEGVVNPNLYFIHRGVVKVWKGYFGAEAQRLHLATLTNNDFFGETSLVQSTAKQQAVPEEDDDENGDDGETAGWWPVRVDDVNTMGIDRDDPYAAATPGDPPVWADYRRILIDAGSPCELVPIVKWNFYEAVASVDHVLTIQTADTQPWANLLLTVGCRTFA